MRLDQRTTARAIKLALCSSVLGLVACSGASQGLPPLDASVDSGPPAENTFDRCQDGQDNDQDGKTDCADDQCAIFVTCGGSARPDAAVDAAPGDQTSGDAAKDGAPPKDAAPKDAAPVVDTNPKVDKLATDTAKAADLPLVDKAPAETAPAKDTAIGADKAGDTLKPADKSTVDKSTCPNGTCNVGESCDGRQSTVNCPQDCPGVTSGPPNQQYCYVDGICQGPGCP